MKNKNLVWGVFFIAAAVLLIFQKQFAFLQISIWTIFLTVILGAVLVKSIRKLEWTGILFSLAFLAIVYADMLHIEHLTPWPVLGAALLGSIGLNLIFHKKPVSGIYVNDKLMKKGEQFLQEDASEEFYKCESAFSTTVKYVNSSNLKGADLENSFGKMTVYFDNAILNEGNVRMNLENSFGEMHIIIPKEWNVEVRTEEAFGHVSYVGDCSHENGSYLKIFAETSFGSIVIHYI